MKSTILLEMKQPNKPEATAARNQNSIGDRMEKKNLGRNQAQSGGPVPLWPEEPAVCYNCSKVRLEYIFLMAV